MESLYFSPFLRVFLLPRVTANFIYEVPEKELFLKISESKQSHSRLISRVIIDSFNKKFWIEAGVYRNITTFKGCLIEQENDNIINGSFTNSGAWISYPIIILAIIAWVYLLISKQNELDISLYLIFFLIFHLSISFSFNKHIENIIKFLETDLGVHASLGEIIPRKS